MPKNGKERNKKGKKLEKEIHELCDKLFLRIWAYPNPYYKGKNGIAVEMRDELVIFGNHVFIFEVKNRKLNINDYESEENNHTQWQKWKKKSIESQFQNFTGVEKNLKSVITVYEDKELKRELKIELPKNPIFHKILIVEGHRDIIKNANPGNISGSLCIKYSNDYNSLDYINKQFYHIGLKKDEGIFHIFDKAIMEKIVSNFTTATDFIQYLEAKEGAIKKLDSLYYQGEEDLIGYYFMNRSYNKSLKKYSIPIPDDKAKSKNLFIHQGVYKQWKEKEECKFKIQQEKKSDFFDKLINNTYNTALKGKLLGSSVFNTKNALYEMASEKRLTRLILSEFITKAIQEFPEESSSKIKRKVTCRLIENKERAYAFLQLELPNKKNIESFKQEDYNLRKLMIEIYCGVMKNKFPTLKKIIGIALWAPKIYQNSSSTDFLLLNCQNYNEEKINYYNDLNKNFGFMSEIKENNYSINEFYES
ncbi:hypothetical protein N9C35_04745 [Flavobacteriaceae bacterium]|nr:hypothetical protein [Flavobacteriaceae bacterium]